MPQTPAPAMPSAPATASGDDYDALMNSLEGENKAAETSQSLTETFAAQSVEILTRAVYAQWLHLGKNGGNSIFYCLRPYGAPWGSHQAMKDSVKKFLSVVHQPRAQAL